MRCAAICEVFYLGCNRYCLNLGFYRYCRVHDHGTHDPAQFLNYSEYESLLYGEQADANPCVREHLHRRANAFHRHHLLQVCSVHLHLLQHEVGAVFEEGWRHSIAQTYYALVHDHPVLIHSDHVLLELHLHEVIKKTNMRYSGDYQLNLFDLKNIV